MSTTSVNQTQLQSDFLVSLLASLDDRRRLLIQHGRSQKAEEVKLVMRKLRTAQHFRLPQDGDCVPLSLLPAIVDLGVKPDLPAPFVSLQYSTGTLDKLQRFVIVIHHKSGFPEQDVNSSRADFAVTAFWCASSCFDRPTALTWDQEKFLIWHKGDLRLRPTKIEYLDEMLPAEVRRREMADDIWRVVVGFLGALRAGVESVKHAAPLKLNKKRKKNGKLPFFDYWVLDIDPMNSAHQSTTESSGAGVGVGDRNSPRLHFRRGHFRRCKSGSVVWVKPCLAGDKSRGFVKKDYNVVTGPELPYGTVH